MVPVKLCGKGNGKVEGGILTLGINERRFDILKLMFRLVTVLIALKKLLLERKDDSWSYRSTISSSSKL